MSCRSTKYLSWACAIQRFVCTIGHSCHVGLQSVHHGLMRFNASVVGPGYVCREGQQSVCHGLAGFNLQFLTGTLKGVPGEFHLGYVMTSCLIHCTYILPTLYQMARCLFHIYDCEWRSDGHFLVHLLCPITLTYFIWMLTDCLLKCFFFRKP